MRSSTATSSEDGGSVGSRARRFPNHDGGALMVEDQPKRRSDISVRPVGGELVVLDRTVNRIHQLNPTATFIWDQCDGQRTVQEIAEQLAGSFEVELDTAREAVTGLIHRLRDLALLELPGIRKRAETPPPCAPSL
jgi:Coenzyme PQQ synthesis protein D (PqqD)